MNSRAICCTQCQAALPNPAFFNTGTFATCPSCQAWLRVELFPAFLRPGVLGPKPEGILAEGESSCFYHPQKKAVVPCDSCGRFLCALCDVDLNDQHLCPACLEKGQQKRTLRNLENSRVRYDTLALALALAPLLAWPLTLLTAPVSIYFGLRHWNSPTSIVRRTKVRLVSAIVVGALEVIAWTIGLTYAFRR